MPGPTPTQASYLARPALHPGMLLNNPTIDEASPLLHWVRIGGYQYEIARIAAADLGAPAWVTSGAATTEAGAIPSARTVWALYRVVGDFDLDTLVQRVYTGDDNDILQIETDAKILALQRALGDAFMNGVVASNQPDGLKAQVAAGQTVGANNDNVNGGALSLADINRMLNLLTAANGDRTNAAIIMNTAVLKKWLDLNVAAGFAPRVAIDPWTGTERYYHGLVRVLISDWIPNNETKGTGNNLSSIYGVVLGYPDGVFGAYKSAQDGRMIEAAQVIKVANDVTRVRIAATGTFVVPTQAALVRCSGIA